MSYEKSQEDLLALIERLRNDEYIRSNFSGNEPMRTSETDYNSDNSQTVTDDEFVDAMSSLHSDASSETYTISGNASAEEEEELQEEPTRKERPKKRLKMLSLKAGENLSTDTDCSPESEDIAPEMMSTNEMKTESATDNSSQTNQPSVSGQKVQQSDQKRPNAENIPEEAVKVSLSTKPHPGTLPKPPAVAEASVQKVPPRPAATITAQTAACIAAAQAAAFQGPVRSSFPAQTQLPNAASTSNSGKVTQKCQKTDPKQASAPAASSQAPTPAPANAQSTSVVAESSSPASATQIEPPNQMKDDIEPKPSKKQTLPPAVPQTEKASIPGPTKAQPSSASSEPMTEKTPKVPNATITAAVTKNRALTNSESGATEQVVSVGTEAATAGSSTANSVAMKTNFNEDTGLPKEKNVGVPTQMSSMIESKVEDLENMEVPSDAIMGLSVTMPSSGFMQKSTEAATTAVAQFETPTRPLKNIDSRTITRPPKMRIEQLPEAVVAPLPKAAMENTTQMVTASPDIKIASSIGQAFPPPIATSTPDRPTTQQPQMAQQKQQQQQQQQHPVVHQPQQVATAPRLMPQQAPEPGPQQATAPKLGPQQAQQQMQQQPLPQHPPVAAAPPVRNITQPIVVPPNIATGPPPATATSQKQEQHSRRDEQKAFQRARQRTITVQSQVSLDITAAYNEVRQMNLDDPVTELVRRVQAIVGTKEKEWAAKNEKLAQLLAHEQRRNEPLEQKAAERLLAMGEYEKLVQEFVDELKKKNSGDKNVTNTGGQKLLGGPGPERNLSPDDVAQLIKERDQLAEEVNSLETSYSELFRRYEKLRQTSIEIKQNEESVKSASEEMAKKYAILAEKFEMLRRNAEEQLDLANNEIERLIKQHESDTLGLRLKVKQLESKNDSLVVSLEARQKELENMTAIFEEVINKAEANDATENT